jgi:hypothetical protein
MNIMQKAFKRVGAAAVVFVSSFTVIHLALADGQTQTIKLTDPLGGSENFTSVATAVAGFLFWDIAVPLATIMVLVGGFQLMTSAGDPEKVSKGKKTIVYAAAGLVAAILAGGIVRIIQAFISGSA